MFKHLITHKKNFDPLLKNRNLKLLIAAGFISRLGSRATYFAMLKKVYDISGGRITDLGFLTVCECLPFLLFGTVAGALIDRRSRKRMMIQADIAGALFVLSAVFIDTLTGVYALSFLSSLVFVFRQPAQSSFEPNLVQKEEIPLANSLSASCGSLTMVLGSAAGAGLVGLLGPNPAFAINALALLVSALLVSCIKHQESHLSSGDKTGGTEEFFQGIRIAWHNPTVRMMLIIDLFVTFAMAVQGVLIYLHLKTGLGYADRAELAWGMLISASGVGVIIGSIYTGIRLKSCSNWFRLYLDILMLDAVNFGLFLLCPYFPLSMVLFGILGAVGGAHMVTLNTTVQKTVTDQHRGKVFAAFTTLNSPVAIASVTVGTFLAGLSSPFAVLMFTAVLEALISIGLRFTITYRAQSAAVAASRLPVETEQAAA
ncbi:MAG: MFS transporter [Candidatus Wallbacteria bacterium]|nr:MFS transporter [Candidatus Wallbacteria bacterium]